MYKFGDLCNVFANIVVVIGIINNYNINLVNGSHWRYGQVSWKVSSGYTVEFTAQIGWRSTYIDSNTFYFGDGSSISMSSSECSSEITPCPSDSTSTVYYELLSTTTDLSGGQAALLKYIFYHTYDSTGPFTYYLDSCCRLSDLVIGDDDDFSLYGTVDMSNGNTGSPVSSISPILQFSLGESNTLSLNPIDNDGDAVTCRKSTSSESGVSSSSFYDVDASSCKLSISESGSVGAKWAAQVFMETSNGDSIPIDFIFEGSDAALFAPVCEIITSPDPTSGNFEVSATKTLTIQLQGTDDDSETLTVTSISVPSGAGILPSGSGHAVPVTVYFTWTPSETQLGSFSASVQMTDSDSQSSLCVIPIFVHPPTMYPTQMPTKIPSNEPTDRPSKQPTDHPTDPPSTEPTDRPTGSPTIEPTTSEPTLSPTPCIFENMTISCDLLRFNVTNETIIDGVAQGATTKFLAEASDIVTSFEFAVWLAITLFVLNVVLCIYGKCTNKSKNELKQAEIIDLNSKQPQPQRSSVLNLAEMANLQSNSVPTLATQGAGDSITSQKSLEHMRSVSNNSYVSAYSPRSKASTAKTSIPELNENNSNLESNDEIDIVEYDPSAQNGNLQNMYDTTDNEAEAVFNVDMFKVIEETSNVNDGHIETDI